MKHLTFTQRYTIFKMYKEKFTQQYIASFIGVSQATVSKELSRNRTNAGNYSATIAQEMADLRKKRYHYKRKFTKDIEELVKKHIEKDWSPAQISHYFKKHNVFSISVERIYQYIRADKKQGGALYLHCRHRLKHRKKAVGAAGRIHIPNRVSIHNRPAYIADRQEFGHWEMDLIQSTNSKQFILTMLERKTRYMLMCRLVSGKNAEGVSKAVIRLLKPYKRYVKTISTDNGGEFAKHKIICKALKTTVYFADPYSSWQKGSIENMNKLIRQYIPKESNFNNLTYNDLVKFEMKLNYRPRQVLGFETPAKLFHSNIN